MVAKETKLEKRGSEDLSLSSSAPSGAPDKNQGKASKGVFSGNFMSESVAELKKIHHPTRQETIQATTVTLIFMGFFAMVLALLDWALRSMMWHLL